jgi:hypothetical protein
MIATNYTTKFTSAARLRARGVRHDMAMRLAIERALIERGYLTITPGRVLRG